jgi:putative aldouronate transport system substrate-binding protein
VLTNKATPEAQVAAIKLVDYMFTEDGQLRAHFGEEGVDWRRPKEGDVALNEEVEPIFATISQPDGAEPRNAGWGAIAQYFQPKTFRDGWVQGTDIYGDDGFERRLQAATDLYAGKEVETPFPHWAVWIDPAVADEAATLRTNISDYVNQNSLQFITGDLDLESGWEEFQAGLEANNLARYLEIMQAAYDASPVK